ncbi:thiosulfate sulfurtransferase GlpE [Oceanobacter sp. 3_MG-2023]|uniref:thiosulfate sulfurtransferase GlpE n=1 Tax=Oceanobacter sp. 3_MG-2023 TaxID=3062622 RepID=UPI00273368CD|nr:thiosulfate sulfurtransferase GlpE [Oceanobacter sp. 3_MG-2023]MDP2505300.1 thiosulfate sulfurtransferase GlpE [Oceanobacter sp. 3_MG-2023]
MSGFTQISAEDAKTMIANNDVQIADIRDAMSYEVGHMTAAQRVDNQNLNEFITATSKQKPLIVCCYHGNSSQGVAQFFSEQGYEAVYSLKGGYEMWKIACPELCQRS